MDQLSPVPSQPATDGRKLGGNGGARDGGPGCPPLQSSGPRAYSLTRRQHRLLLFIQGFLEAHGYSPSFREMMDGTGNSSVGGIAGLVDGLEELGAIRRLHSHHRAIEVLHPIAIPRTPDRTAPLRWVEMGRTGQAARPASVSRGRGSSAVSEAGLHLHGEAS